MRWRSLWFVLLASSPLAYFGATMLEDYLPHDPKISIVTRQEAVDAAVRLAARLGRDARAWTSTIAVERHDTSEDLLRRYPSPALERIVAAATIDILLRDPTQPQWVKVNLSPGGRVIGFTASNPVGESPAQSEEAALRAGEACLLAILGPDPPFHPKHAATHPTDKTGERDFVWESEVPEMPGATATFHVHVARGQVTGVNAALDPGPRFPQASGRTKTRAIAFAMVMLLYMTAFSIYALVRYVQRSLEREVSHRRTLLVVLLFAVSGAVGLYLNGEEISIAVNGEPAAGAQLILVLALVLIVPGIALGVAYGAGEGDLREAFPGKLLSLDACLSGKIFSANCARSILAGGALAGWLLLVENVVLLFLRGTPIVSPADLVTASLMRSPLAQAVANVSSSLTVAVAFGLMLPLTLLHSRIRNPWILYPAVFVLSCVTASRMGAGAAALTLTHAAAMCVPFVLGDLLSAVSCLAALSFVGTLVRESAVSAEWHTIAYRHVLPAAIVLLGVELYFAWRGRVCRESEVRPVYARHLAERLALTAEIGAARLAQVRLLPDCPPEIAGLSIAGSCTPAREVGGDFFDYYALDDHRLGLFVAEGGNRELGSAMAIALAKGYLLYTTRLDLTPVEVLRRLRTTLASVLLGENASMTVVYAVIDARNGSLRYARAGASPRIVVNGVGLAEEIVGDRAGGMEIRHGAAMLAANDVLVVYTDGWARLIAERRRVGADVFLKSLDAPDASEAHRAVIGGALEHPGAGIDDDVTAVVVMRHAMVAEAMGGIA